MQYKQVKELAVGDVFSLDLENHVGVVFTFFGTENVGGVGDKFQVEVSAEIDYGAAGIKHPAKVTLPETTKVLVFRNRFA
jgi:hypothetical protein